MGAGAEPLSIKNLRGLAIDFLYKFLQKHSCIEVEGSSRMWVPLHASLDCLVGMPVGSHALG